MKVDLCALANSAADLGGASKTIQPAHDGLADPPPIFGHCGGVKTRSSVSYDESDAGVSGLSWYSRPHGREYQVVVPLTSVRS